MNEKYENLAQSMYKTGFKSLSSWKRQEIMQLVDNNNFLTNNDLERKLGSLEEEVRVLKRKIEDLEYYRDNRYYDSLDRHYVDGD